MRHLPPFRPDVCARSALAELERPIDDAELRVDLQRACLHAECPGLQRRPRMSVDDQHAHTSPTELIGEHQPGRACADDQNVSIHSRPFARTNQHQPLTPPAVNPPATRSWNTAIRIEIGNDGDDQRRRDQRRRSLVLMFIRQPVYLCTAGRPVGSLEDCKLCPSRRRPVAI